MISDTVKLGFVAGMCGNLVKTIIDDVSVRLKVSQRPYRSTAAGVWVSSYREAESAKGRLLGAILDSGMSWLGGIAIVNVLRATGKDHVVGKGVISGLTLGSAITAIMSGFPNNKVQSRDAASNLSYMLTHIVYGIVTAMVATRLGDPALFVQMEPMSGVKRWMGRMAE